MKFADLHVHTFFSDGSFSPKEVIEQAVKKKLSAIAIVDHDTIEGIDEALVSSRVNDIEVIPGIELTAAYLNKEIHFLGYLIDYQDREFCNRLKLLKEYRIERVYKITEKLKNQGIDLDAKSVFDIAPKGTVGRLHIAQALINQGFVSSVYEAFNKYIGDNAPCYVCGFRFSPQEAIRIIKDVGGIPVLAHPYLIKEDDSLKEFVGYGLMGIEAYYPEHTHSMTNFYLEFAQKNNLLITGGSDFHGLAKADIKLGCVKVAYSLVERLKEAKS